VGISVWTPQHLSKEEKNTIAKMAESENMKPQPNAKDKSFFEKMREFFQ
jgi:molecular chaperone DnaJ